MAEGSFPRADFVHTANVIRSGSHEVVRAILSNNRNIILAALDFAAADLLRAKEWDAVLDALDQVLAGDHEALDLPMPIYQAAYDRLAARRDLEAEG